MEYQYWVTQDWNNSIAKKCGMSIGEYYDSVVKHLPSTEASGENAFEPVQLNLKLGKDVCVPLSVAVTDKWYERLQQIVTDTYFRHQRTIKDPKQVKFVDVTRKDIRGLSGDQLATCGKIRAFVGDQWLTADNQENVEPPTALRTDKQTQLVNWFDRKCKERLVQATVRALSNCDQHELVLRTKKDGPLDRDICQILRESVPGGVSNVMETYGCTEKARAASADTAIARASETILRQIRQGLRTNQAAVARNIQARISASVSARAGGEDSEEPPLFESMADVPIHEASQEQKLFTGIARKALGKGVINIINHFYRGIGCGVCDTKNKKKDRVEVMDKEEDEAYYNDYYYGAVNKHFQDKYHAVAGRAIFMEPAATATERVGSEFQGLRGARLRKKIGESVTALPPRPKTMPLESVYPIGNQAVPQKPRLVPIGGETRPRLVPLEQPEPAPVKRDRQAPVGVIVNGPLRPRLVPIGGDVNPQKPRLVPIGDHVDLPRAQKTDKNLTKGVQKVNDGMPDFLDFLNKRK